jgi:hypothetical protein
VKRQVDAFDPSLVWYDCGLSFIWGAGPQDPHLAPILTESAHAPIFGSGPGSHLRSQPVTVLLRTPHVSMHRLMICSPGESKKGCEDPVTYHEQSLQGNTCSVPRWLRSKFRPAAASLVGWQAGLLAGDQDSGNLRPNGPGPGGSGFHDFHSMAG